LLPTGSFKLRGVANKLRALGDAAKPGVIAASTGNHGMAVAYAGRQAGVPVTVFATGAAPEEKLAAMRAFGAQVTRVEGHALGAEAAARAHAEAQGLAYISPYNDLDMMAGHAAIAREILAQAPHVDAIALSVGGGGLLGGVGVCAKALKPGVSMIGVWPERAAGLLDTIEADHFVEEIEQPTLSEATAGGPERNSLTIPIAADVLDEGLRVSEAEIGRAMRLVAEHEHWIVEGAAGVAVAGVLRRPARGKAVAVLLCGRNVALSTFLNAIAL
jgi:threonine dehydratase